MLRGNVAVGHHAIGEGQTLHAPWKCPYGCCANVEGESCEQPSPNL